MHSAIQAKREERVGLVAQAQELLKQDTMTTEDEQKFDRLMEESDTIKAQIDRMERALTAEQDLKQRIDMTAGRENISPDQAQELANQKTKIFNKWVMQGLAGLSPEEHQAMLALRSPVQGIYGAQSVGTNTAGGFTVPNEQMQPIEDAMLQFGGMRQAATIISTSSGASLPIPTSNDTGQTGERIAENTSQNNQDVTFGQLTLDAYKYSSKIVLVSLELLQDSSVNLDTFLFGKLGERIGRIVNTELTTGTGSSQPNGIVTAATLGKTGAGGQVTTVIYDDLVDLEHSVDAAYRTGARWMFADSTLKAIKKLKDANGLPLWSAGLAVREPDTILGYPYIINNDVPAMAASAKSIVFGALNKYLIRDVLGVTLFRLVERYAEFAQVGFIAISRHDGDLLDAGTNPVKYYQNPAV